MTQYLNGWDWRNEEKDFESFSTELKGNIIQFADVEAELQRDANNPATAGIDEIARTLYAEGYSTYDKFVIGRQDTNDCMSFGATVAFDLTQEYQTWRYKEHQCFRSHPCWVYGCGKYMMGERRNSGMTISSAMRWIVQEGMLPMDTPGVPAYSGALQVQLLRNGKAFYEQYKDHAVVYDITCVPLPADEEAWQLFIASGRAIAYGTFNLMRLRSDGMWEFSGQKGGHAMCMGPPLDDTKLPSNYNSWGEGRGGHVPRKVLQRIIQDTRSFGSAIGFHGFTPRVVTPNYQMIGR